jgi:hypothetical protein
MGKLGGYVNPGHAPEIKGAREDFADLKNEIKRTGI